MDNFDEAIKNETSFNNYILGVKLTFGSGTIEVSGFPFQDRTIETNSKEAFLIAEGVSEKIKGMYLMNN
ncbi:MAG: hypothetical protein HRT47_04400 [Candidatus Caenarcaniphilales bacterium]|nr:hypothetical protein [Candidatus Caenarcaniphilales bacterium]